MLFRRARHLSPLLLIAALVAPPSAGAQAARPRRVDVSGPGNAMSFSSGSGFVVDGAGHVLTNKHVVRSCAAIRVRGEGTAPVTASVVATDPDDDLALLRTTRPVLAPARFRATAGPRAGDDVIALGFPLVGLLGDQMHVSVGIVNALAGMYNDLHNLQMSAPVQPGNSGGPLLDASGLVVGVVVTKLDARSVAEEVGDLPQNVNFAIKASVAREFLDANGVRYRTASSKSVRSNADVADIGREATVLVECVRGAASTAR